MESTADQTLEAPSHVTYQPIQYQKYSQQPQQQQQNYQQKRRSLFDPKLAFSKKFDYLNNYHNNYTNYFKKKTLNYTQASCCVQEDQLNNDQIYVDFEDNYEKPKSNKEKTPMCLVNELARHNKLKPQYVLQNETGPAHKKTFTVTLKLASDGEEYTAQGGSIKRAQHAAAQLALDNTKYPLAPKRKNIGLNPALTPAAKLNSLAKAYGLEANYMIIDNQKNFHFAQFTPTQCLFTVKLSISDQTFFGEANTHQEAKHRAACKALQYISQNKSLFKRPEKLRKEEQLVPNEEKEPLQQQTQEKHKLVKNEISQVHEIAARNGLKVDYEVLSENGPSHDKIFLIKCKIGLDLETLGEGSSKKESKKNAASKMLNELNKQGALNEPKVRYKKQKPLRDTEDVIKRPKNLLKIKKASPDYGKGSINPTVRLFQVQQAKNQPEPIYEFTNEKLKFRNKREFSVKVTIGNESCIGVGSNKRTAKCNASEKMLIQLGFQPTMNIKPVLKKNATCSSGKTPVEKHVKFVDVDSSLTSSMSNLSVSGQVSNVVDSPKSQMQSKLLLRKHQQRNYNSHFSRTLYYTYLVAHELLTSFESKTADLLKEDKQKKLNLALSVNNDVLLEPKQELKLTQESSFKDKFLFLADLMNFQVNFHSLSKKDEGITSYVTMSIIPQPERPLNGSGKTSIESCNAASQCALKYLADKYDELVDKNLSLSIQAETYNGKCELTSLSVEKQDESNGEAKEELPKSTTDNQEISTP